LLVAVFFLVARCSAGARQCHGVRVEMIVDVAVALRLSGNEFGQACDDRQTGVEAGRRDVALCGERAE